MVHCLIPKDPYKTSRNSRKGEDNVCYIKTQPTFPPKFSHRRFWGRLIYLPMCNILKGDCKFIFISFIPSLALEREQRKRI